MKNTVLKIVVVIIRLIGIVHSLVYYH